MDEHPIQGGVEILSVASCYRNRDKLRPDGPLGPNADFTFFFNQIKRSLHSLEKRSTLVFFFFRDVVYYLLAFEIIFLGKSALMRSIILCFHFFIQ